MLDSCLMIAPLLGFTTHLMVEGRLWGSKSGQHRYHLVKGYNLFPLALVHTKRSLTATSLSNDFNSPDRTRCTYMYMAGPEDTSRAMVVNQRLAERATVKVWRKMMKVAQ